MRTSFQIMLLFISMGCAAQQMPRTRITTVPTQFVFLELPITIERAAGRSTIGIAGGFRPGVKQSGKIDGSGAYHLQNYWNFAYSNATIGLMHKYHLRDRFGLHIESSLHFRQWWFDRKQLRYDGDGSFDALRSEEQRVFILKAVLGKSIMWKRSGKPVFIMEYFAGPSIRRKDFRFTTHSGTIDGSEVIDHLEQGEIWSPGLQIGMRIGIGFE